MQLDDMKIAQRNTLPWLVHMAGLVQHVHGLQLPLAKRSESPSGFLIGIEHTSNHPMMLLPELEEADYVSVGACNIHAS